MINDADFRQILSYKIVSSTVADPDAGVLVGSGCVLNKIQTPSKIELFLHNSLAKVILQYLNINHIDFFVERKK